MLVELRQTLLQQHAAALIALYGTGGVGKTQLAAEYAHAKRGEYKAVWWLNAEAEATLANDLAALARALDLPEKDTREICLIVATVLHWLNGNTDWLLIYDNATDAKSLQGYLPHAHSGHVLVTSRNPNWLGLAQALEVTLLDAEDGAKFLVERTGQDDAAAARELAEELGGLPLALEQAGAYCEATKKPLADYLRLFRQRGQELLQRGQPADYPATVATTWEISFEAAQRECPAAAALLNLLAFCAPEAFPLSVFRNGVEQLPDELASAVADELAFDDAIAALRRYSLLVRENDSVTLHRLVQLVTRERQTGEEQKVCAEAAVRIINRAFAQQNTDEQALALLAHALVAVDHGERLSLLSSETTRLVNGLADLVELS